MKQKSLFQSWSKIHNDFQHDQSQSITDATDKILVNALEQLGTNGNGDQECNKEEEKHTFIRNALSNRTKVVYHRTANDFEELKNFDVNSGAKWIYPSDSQLRNYQLNIIEQCLFKNTLVCLPTGLGKTFIAAVLIYNFLRWYPTGKLIFLAPTRPLVTQQLKACTDFIKYFNEDNVIELTGSVHQQKRRSIWLEYSAFFLTPQVLVNDLQSGICPGNLICLLIFDEAHKATGNHAYCQVLRLLTNEPYQHRQFRIVGLSATPASNIEGVQLLIANLLITHLELRSETSADVSPYTQYKHVETVIVQLGTELKHYHDQLVDCIKLPLDRLIHYEALNTIGSDLRPERLVKFTILKARDWWSQNKQPNCSTADSSTILADFNLIISLLHALELLIQHGLRPVYHYLEQQRPGSHLTRLPIIRKLCSDLALRFHFESTASDKPAAISSQLPFLAGHPKLEKLKLLLIEHFKLESFKSKSSDQSKNTRVIIFSQFRNSVEEIMDMLKLLKPTIKPASFIGQGSTNNHSSTKSPSVRTSSECGISQRDQMKILESFREGVINTLVSTCVGEEGIDIGHVDLIICFDAFKSPIRLIQRFGRTGRQRFGRIIMLLTEGREERNYAYSMAKSESLQKLLINKSEYSKLAFYPHNPRMIPIGIEPNLVFENLKPDCSMALHEKVKKIPSKLDQKTGLTKFNTFSFQCKALLTITDNANDNNNNCNQNNAPTFTEYYKKVSFKYLKTLQSTVSGVHSSYSTRHLVSIFRLIEMHRLNLTILNYHAMGLRSVDVDKNWDEYLKEHHITDDGKACLTQYNESPIKVSKIQQDLKEQTVDVTQDVHPNESLISADGMPKLIKGLVSESIFFHPKSQTSNFSKDMCSDNSSNLSMVNITFESLRQTWTDFLGDFSKVQVFSQLSSSPINSNHGTLKVNEPNLVSMSSDAFDFGDQIQEKFNFVQAFNLPRSTPYARDGDCREDKNLPTQLDLSAALALLENSTIQLDTSKLLYPSDSDYNRNQIVDQDNAKMQNTFNSALFTTQLYEPPGSKSDLFTFKTKLSFSEDLEDIIKPTQQHLPSHFVNQDVSPSFDPKTYVPSNDSIDDDLFSSKINWSPISDTFNLENASFTFCQNPPRTSSPVNKLRTKKSPSNITSSKVPAVRNRKRRTVNEFVLTQADCSDDSSELQLSCDSEYDESFINDGTLKSPCSNNQISKSNFDSSDMMGVYLQTIRSPPLIKPISKFEVVHNRQKRPKKYNCNVESATESSEDDFQPEIDDEYELDSFCVDDSTPIPVKKNYAKRKIRRRVITGSQY